LVLKLLLVTLLKSRINDERVFFPISQKEMTLIFENENFKELESYINNDNLKRDIEWITQVYEL